MAFSSKCASSYALLIRLADFFHREKQKFSANPGVPLKNTNSHQRYSFTNIFYFLSVPFSNIALFVQLCKKKAPPSPPCPPPGKSMRWGRGGEGAGERKTQRERSADNQSCEALATTSRNVGRITPNRRGRTNVANVVSFIGLIFSKSCQKRGIFCDLFLSNIQNFSYEIPLP
jgi:hypothetical protein